MLLKLFLKKKREHQRDNKIKEREKEPISFIILLFLLALSIDAMARSSLRHRASGLGHSVELDAHTRSAIAALSADALSSGSAWFSQTLPMTLVVAASIKSKSISARVALLCSIDNTVTAGILGSSWSKVDELDCSTWSIRNKYNCKRS